MKKNQKTQILFILIVSFIINSQFSITRAWQNSSNSQVGLSPVLLAMDDTGDVTKNSDSYIDIDRGERTTPDAKPTAVLMIKKTPAGYTTSLGDLISGVLSIVMLIAGILVLLYLIWGAIQWITSGGDKGKLESARNRITQAVIGLIVLGATIAVFTLVQAFMGITIFKFTFLGGGGNGTGTGVGSNKGNCTVTGQKVLDGTTKSSYCTSGGAMVECHGPDSHLDYNHYDPCYCVDGIDKQKAGYDWGSC